MRHIRRGIAGLLIAAMIITLCPVQECKVSARLSEVFPINEENQNDYKVEFSKHQETLITTDRINLSTMVSNNLPEGLTPTYSYEVVSSVLAEGVYDDGWGSPILTKQWDEEGVYAAGNAGTATVRVTMSVVDTDSEDAMNGRPITYKWSDDIVITVLSYQDQSFMVGETTQLHYTEYERYKNGRYEIDQYCASYASVDESGNITFLAPGYVRVYLMMPGSEGRILVATYNCREAELGTLNDFVLAVGSPAHALTLTLTNKVGKMEWTSSDSSIASVDGNGNVTAVAEGTATITASWKTASGVLLKSTSCVANITNPRLSIQANNIGIQDSFSWFSYSTTTVPTDDTNLLTVPLLGTCENSQVIYTSSDLSIVTVNEYGNLTPIKVGTAKITIQADGITMVYTVRVTKPKLKSSTLMLVKGKKSTLKLKGTNSYSKPVFTSMSKKIATISSKGSVKAKKYGSSALSCRVDGITLYASVAVGKAKLIKGVKAARKVLGSRYSQAKRMQKGYYDCSSLVWRSFKQVGLYFGSKNYAPTAAGIAQYMAKKKWVVSKKAVPYTKLQPGDILFFSSGKNGRYRNITHVGIYSGNLTMIHANGSVVAEVEYYERMDTVLVARPYK